MRRGEVAVILVYGLDGSRVFRRVERHLGDAMKRPPNPCPDFVAAALKAAGLEEAYRQRPWYQRNDYLGWINRAKRDDTKMKRLQQMLDELRRGDVYMKMDWRAKK